MGVIERWKTTIFILNRDYQQNIDLIQVGAYEMGTNPDLDRAIALRSVMEEFLRQPMDELVTFEAAVTQLRESISV